MPTTNGNMKSLKVTDKDGNVYVLVPVDTQARQAIDEAKNLQFDDDFFTSEVSQDQATVSVGLNGVPIGIETDSPLKFVQDTAQGIVFGSDAPFSTALAPEYDSTATYAVDDHCMRLGKYYRCNTAISTAEAWTPAHWTETDIEATYATKSEVSAATASPNDGFYVSRNGRWIKVYGLTVNAIEGFPVDDLDYQKIGQFNGNLYTHAQITVEGSATVGMFNYDTLDYDSETTVEDSTELVDITAGGSYEIHAKGAGVVTVIVSADEFNGDSENG